MNMKKFLPVIFISLLVVSCASTPSATDSFDGLWTKRECAQIASDFVLTLDESSFSEDFFRSHGQTPVVAVGFISTVGDFEPDAAQFASYLASEARRAKSFTLELYEKKVFASDTDARVWAVDNGVDFLICGCIETRVEEKENARPVRRYVVSVSVLDLANDFISVYDWTDSHLAKAIRRITVTQ